VGFDEGGAGGIIYAKVTRGGLTIKDRNSGKSTISHTYTGYVQEIKERESEYEGQTQYQVQVFFKEDGDDPKVCVTFNQESWAMFTFFDRLRSVNFSKKLTLGVSGSEQNEKVSFIWMKQGADVIKKRDELPKPKKIKRGRGGRAETDWVPVVEAASPILQWAKKQLEELNGGPSNFDKGEGESESHPHEASGQSGDPGPNPPIDEDDDGLPF